MRIWIDGDACPREIKDIVFRASERLEIPVRLVANSAMLVPRSDLVSVIVVAHGLDSADEHIVDELTPDDIVVTGDIPLAARIVDKGGIVIDPRGSCYDERNMAERLAARNLTEELRSIGLAESTPSPFAATDNHKFAATLDRILTRWRKKQP